MNDIFLIFLGIVVLFILLLLVKDKMTWKFCVLCASISATWVFLLILYWLGFFHDPIIIAVFMGQSVVGIYFLLEKKVSEKFHVFRLPFLLSATLFVYVSFGFGTSVFHVAVLLGILWVVLFLVYRYRNDMAFKKTFERIVACCRDW